MTSELNLIVRGEGAEEAVRALDGALSTDGAAVSLERREPEALPEAARKAVDPVSLAALILSIPSVVLGALDLADRIEKRKRAQRLLEEVKRLRLERRVEIDVVTLEGPRALDGLDADQLIELAVRTRDRIED